MHVRMLKAMGTTTNVYHKSSSAYLAFQSHIIQLWSDLIGVHKNSINRFEKTAAILKIEQCDTDNVLINVEC